MVNGKLTKNVQLIVENRNRRQHKQKRMRKYFNYQNCSVKNKRQAHTQKINQRIQRKVRQNFIWQFQLNNSWSEMKAQNETILIKTATRSWQLPVTSWQLAVGNVSQM